MLVEETTGKKNKDVYVEGIYRAITRVHVLEVR